MKAKTFILTFLMMMSSTFLFGQNVLPGGYNMTITSEIILDGDLQTNTNYLVYAMHDGTVLGQSSIMKEGPDEYIDEPLYYVNLEVEGNSGDVINFKLVADGKTYISSTEVDYEDNAMLGNLENLWTIEFKTVAQIGDVVYPSLQKAIDACKEGDNTIELLADNAEDVTIKQVEGVNVTIDGGTSRFDYSGTITIHGNARYQGEETLTFKNIDFTTNEAGHYFIDSNSTGSVERYAHNVTVSNCNFTATGAGVNSAAAMRIRQGFDIAINGSTFTNLHSALQAYGNAGITVSGITLNGKNGISAGTSTGVVIENSDITATGYGVRADGTGAYDMTLTGTNTITAELPVVVRNTTGAYKLTVESGTYTALNGNPAVTFTTGDDGTFVAPTSPATSDLADGISTFGFEAKIGTVYHTTFVNAYAAAAAGDVITLLKDQNFSEIITLDKAITLDGGNYKLTSTAGRAINVDCAGEVTIKNLTIVGSTGCERGINIIDQAGITNIENVTISGQSHYAVHMATSAGAAKVNVKNSNLTGYGAFVVYGKGSVNTIENSTLVGINTYDDNGSNNFGTIVADVENTTITVTGGNITAKAEEGKAGMAIFTGKNGNNANVTLNSTLALEGAAKYIEILNKTTTLKVKAEYATAIQAEGFATSDPDNALVKVEGVAVAKIGETKYATLAKAITAAQANDVIVLLADITENVSVGKSLTIDGENNTYTGKMEMKANITVKNVNFDGNGYNGYAVETRNASVVVIEDCTAKNYGYGFLQIASNNHTTTVKNVTISNVNYGVKVDYSNGVVLENVYINAAVAAVLNSNYGTKTITIKNSNLSILGTWTRNNTIKTTYVFEGENSVGEFEIDAAIDNFKLADVSSTLTAPNDITVTTGVDGYVVKYEDGKYVVKGAVAKIGDEMYASIAEAITAAQAGNTIVLLADITENVTVNKNVTIDGGYKNYTGTMTISSGKTVTVQNVNFVKGCIDKTKGTSGTLTVMNCDFDGVDNSIAYAVTMRGGNSVTIEGGEVKNYDYGMLYVPSVVSNVSVKGTTVKGGGYGVHVAYGSKVNIEGVTMEDVAYGIMTQNYGAKTITIKNSNISATNPIYVWERNTTIVDTFKFEGANTLSTLTSSNQAKLVLAAADATLTAPEGYTVTTTVENNLVKYVDGAYKVVPAVAKIGDDCYETLADAIAAIGADDVTIVLLANASLDITAWQTLAIGGDNTTSITIDGDNGEEEDFTLTFNKLNSDWNHVATSNGNTTKLILKNLKLADSGYNNGPWNRYDIVFASDVELNNVVSAKALAFKANATLNNVTINESGDNYAIWIQPNGQSVTIDGLVINSAGRGIKVDEQYVTAQNVSLSVANATFTTAKKAAIMVKSSAETTITVGEDVNIANVAADKTNIAWVDEDAAAHYGKVTVTDGTLTQENLPVFVAALMNDAMVEGYYKVFEEALAAAANEKILVLKTVVFDTDKVIDFEGKEVNSNVNPAFRITNDATVTVKNGNMNTAEGYNFILGASDSSSAGNLTIESGTFHGATTVASVTMGSLNITGGEFSVEPYQGNYAFLINCYDPNYNNGAEVSISGGTFHKWNPENNAAEGANTNFCAPGHVAVYDAVNDTYTVIEADYVAQIGEVKYISLQAAINAAENGDKIVVLEDLKLSDEDVVYPIENNSDVKVMLSVKGKDITLDLNEKTIEVDYEGGLYLYAVVFVEDGANLTVTGNGKIDVLHDENRYVQQNNVTRYNVAYMFWKRGNTGSLVIENGTFHAYDLEDSIIYTNGNELVTVKGGNFSIDMVDDQSPWIFNGQGQNANKVIVKGGTFNADINHQFWANEVYVPETLALQYNGDEEGTWTVVESVAYVEEIATSTGSTVRKVGYATIEDAIEAIGIRNTNETVTMLKDVELENTITIAAGKEVILDLNGKTITGKDKNESDSFNLFVNKGTFEIKDDSAEGTGKITLEATTNRYWNASSSIVSNSAGTLTITSGTLEHLGGTDMAYAIDNNSTLGLTTLNVDGGKIASPYRAIRQFQNSLQDNVVVVNGGTISARAGIWMQQPSTNDKAQLGTLTINDGSIFECVSNAVVIDICGGAQSNVTINGGTFSNTNENANLLLIWPLTDMNSVHENCSAVMNITGGNFTCTGEGKLIGILDGANTNGDVVLTGGIYSEDVNDYCAEGFAAVDNGDGTWTVMPVQEQSLPSGWSWYSTYLVMDLDDLTTALGDNGVQIKNQIAKYKQYDDDHGTWFGNLTAIDLRDMYMVNVKADQTLKVAAPLAVTEEYTITINPGWNWIGYPSNVNVDINTVLTLLAPEKNDLIKTQHKGYAQFNYNKWRGALKTMLPGEGYMYYSNATESKTFVYTVEATKGTVEANVTAENNYWTPDATKYPFNMTMTAVVDGLTDANYEVAAFVNGEVRGSARPIYIEEIDAYVLFLTIHGEDVEEMSFRLYDIDNDTEYDLSDRINYSNDAHLGSVNEPYVFSRGTIGIGEAAMSQVNIYPNPTTTGTEINLQATCDTVEVFNALGVKVAEYQNVDTIDALETAGIYVIRITNDGNVQNCRLVVK